MPTTTWKNYEIGTSIDDTKNFFCVRRWRAISLAVGHGIAVVRENGCVTRVYAKSLVAPSLDVMRGLASNHAECLTQEVPCHLLDLVVET